MNLLVLGIGSVLMMDEGIGVRAVEELGRKYRFPDEVELLDGGTSGIGLLSYIAGRDCLLVIDAIKSGHQPGTVLRLEGDDVPPVFRTRISPHQLGLSDLLAAAALTDGMPGKLLLFGIEPKTISMGLGLSEEVEKGLAHLLEVIVEEIRDMGITVAEREQTGQRQKSFWDPVGV